MKTHYKRVNHQWQVFEDRTEDVPILMVDDSIHWAALAWEEWELLQRLQWHLPPMSRTGASVFEAIDKKFNTLTGRKG